MQTIWGAPYNWTLVHLLMSNMSTQQWSLMAAARRRQEIVQMEACDVPRASRNGDLRAAFQAGQRQEAEMVVPSSTIPRYVTTAGNDQLTPVGTHPSTSFGQPFSRHDSVIIEQRQRYNTDRLRPVPSQSFRKPESIPVHRTRKPINESFISKEHEWGVIPAEPRLTCSNAQVHPPTLGYISDDSSVEPESTLIVYEDRSTQNQKLYRCNSDSDSSYVPSIHMTVNKLALQHNHRQRPQTPNEEDETSFDGLRNPKEHIDNFRRSSYYSEWEELPGLSGNIVPDPPVVRKVASWVADKLQNRACQVAGAFGLRPTRRSLGDCCDSHCKLGRGK